MRIDKFTQKMQEAVQASQDVASEFNQQEITNEHFLLALLDQAEGITRPLLEKMGVPTESLKEQLRGALQKLRPNNPVGMSINGSGMTSAAYWTAPRRRWRN